MNTVQRIAKNTGVLLFAQIASSIFGFFFVMYTARYLGAAGFGILSFALAFAGIFGVFTDLGLGTLTVREVARDKSLASKYLGNIAVMKIILVIITFGLIVLTINLLGYPEQTIKVVYLVALSVVFGAFSQMFYSIFQAYEKMEYQSIGKILNSVLMLGGALFVISQGFSVVGFAYLYFLIHTVILAYCFIVSLWKLTKPKIEIDWGFWKKTIKDALPFGLIGIFMVIYFKIDTIMLSMMQGDNSTGWYNASYLILEKLLIISTIWYTSLFPVFSKLYKTSSISLMKSYQISLKFMIILFLPISTIFTIFAEKIILLIYGIEYMNSVIPLQILVWASVLISVSSIFGILIGSINKQKIVSIFALVCAITNVILNMIFIPSLNYIGASITTIITEFIFLISLYWYVSREGYIVSISKLFIKPVFASMIVGLFAYLFKDIFSGWVLGLFVLILLILYIVILYFTNTFIEEKKIIYNSFIKKWV